MPVWVEAGLWGLLSGSALLVGAGVAWLLPVPRKVVAGVMAFGAGVLISALAFDLVDEAETSGGLGPTVTRPARRRRRRTSRRTSPWPGAAPGTASAPATTCSRPRTEHPGSGAAIAVGALLDGVPESVVLGLTLLEGGGGRALPCWRRSSISNVPEGLSSAAGMKRSGRSASYVFGVWGGDRGGQRPRRRPRLPGARRRAPAATLAMITALAAGAILAMVADTMIPEAFDEDPPVHRPAHDGRLHPRLHHQPLVTCGTRRR